MSSAAFRLLLIRHAHAYEREMWDGSDLERPLIPKGKKVAKRVGQVLASALSHNKEKLDVLFASQAARSHMSAQQILKSFPDLAYIKTPLINPETGIDGYLDIVRDSQEDGNMFIAIVGHEYDLSKVVNHLCGNFCIKWKKGGYLTLSYTDGVWCLEIGRV